jgi:selenide,water dikinase
LAARPAENYRGSEGMQGAATADLVLVGGGHAHVQVVRRWMMAPMAGVRLTVVLDRPDAVYSGMVPGFVAGDYAAHELEIDLVPLARRARARVVLSPVTGVDASAQRIELEGRPSMSYDVASLDVGSSVRGLELPGVSEHALSTRPIRRFVDDLDARLRVLRDSEQPRIVVVGAGAAGCELVLTLDARLRSEGTLAELSLLGDGAHPLDGYPARVGRAVERELRRRGIRLLLGERVRAVSKEGLLLEDGDLAADLVVWATGASPLPFLRDSSLPTDAAGFVQVTPTLAVVGHDDLFAAGDCAALPWAPWVRKAGVYAVRAGPVLDANLRARLRGRSPRPYRPQRDFLTLLNLGGGRALGAKWGAVVSGRPVFGLKDWIDRRFMRRFRVLEDDASEALPFPSREQMGMEEMVCGGCAAKVGQSALARALARLPEARADESVLVGLAEPDDAAAIRLPRGDVLLATVDAFRAPTDDPWLVGRAAAVNAVSDVLAKGAVARHALAIVTVPETDPGRAEESLYQVLAGIRAALDPRGVTLVGGHSTQGEDLFVGLAVTGEPLGGEVLRLGGARSGDALLLSRPLGSGVLLAADMAGRAPGRWIAAVLASLQRDNADAATVARACHASASTDVSGFGLAGHLAEMLRASGAAGTLSLGSLPAFEGTLALLGLGVRSTFHEQNALGRRGLDVPRELSGDPRLELLFDPQTCGGLLFAVPADRAGEALAALRDAGGEHAARIGEVTSAAPGGAVFRVVP